MLTRRIIPCLDVREGVVVKGVQFRRHVVLGEILDFVVKYRDDGADELVFYDITASSENRRAAVQWVEKAAEILDIPFCVAGGIRSPDDARRILNSGADKVSVNSPALENPDLINRLASEFGSQCVVVGIDSRYEQGNWLVYQYTGHEATARSSRRLTMDWIKEVQERGAGEIVLNCMNSDGVGAGYDIEQLCYARNVTKIPLIASGGAGKTSHFEEVFRVARVDGALAAGVFHRNEITIPALKQALQDSGIQVRPAQMRAI